MNSTKINLAEFKEAQLEVDQLLAAKGGCGSTSSRRTSTTCTGTDSDSRRTDSDS